MRPQTGSPGSGRRSCSSGSSRRGGLGLRGAIAVALVAIVAGAAPCSAGSLPGLEIVAPNLNVMPGTTGSFDLLLVNNPGAGSFNIAADQFTVSLSGPAGISFTDVSIATDPVAAPYIFVSSGTLQSPFPPLATVSPTSFTALDAEFASPFYRMVNEGDTFGLAHVSYSVDPTTPIGTTDTLTISPSPGNSFIFTDDTGNFITAPVVITNGSITAGPSAVPEPWALTQAATAVLMGLGLILRSRRCRDPGET